MWRAGIRTYYRAPVGGRIVQSRIYPSPKPGVAAWDNSASWRYSSAWDNSTGTYRAARPDDTPPDHTTTARSNSRDRRNGEFERNGVEPGSFELSVASEWTEYPRRDQRDLPVVKHAAGGFRKLRRDRHHRVCHDHQRHSGLVCGRSGTGQPGQQDRRQPYSERRRRFCLRQQSGCHPGPRTPRHRRISLSEDCLVSMVAA